MTYSADVTTKGSTLFSDRRPLRADRPGGVVMSGPLHSPPWRPPRDPRAGTSRPRRPARRHPGWLVRQCRPVSPHGRRIYQAVPFSNSASSPSPPALARGRADLPTRVLRDWRTEHVVPADFDASRSGAMRRALVATGLALAEETDDGRERADCLVLEATLSVRARKLEVLDADLACRPRSRPARAGPRSITPRIARRVLKRSEHLRRHPWIIKRTLAWPPRFRRLAIRYKRCTDLHLAFTTFSGALICRTQARRLCP